LANKKVQGVKSKEKTSFEGIDRSSRAKDSREKTASPRPWTPPSSLEAPPAPTGFKHRWIRVETRGQDDTKNVSSRLREGFEFVRADEYENTEYEGMYPVLDTGRLEGVIGVGGLVLARIPMETVRQRNAYFNEQSQGLVAAADSELMQENNHETMRIFNPDRKNRVTFGGSSR
jgi:hypothetical protein